MVRHRPPRHRARAGGADANAPAHRHRGRDGLCPSRRRLPPSLRCNAAGWALVSYLYHGGSMAHQVSLYFHVEGAGTLCVVLYMVARVWVSLWCGASAPRIRGSTSVPALGFGRRTREFVGVCGAHDVKVGREPAATVCPCSGDVAPNRSRLRRVPPERTGRRS